MSFTRDEMNEFHIVRDDEEMSQLSDSSNAYGCTGSVIKKMF